VTDLENCLTARVCAPISQSAVWIIRSLRLLSKPIMSLLNSSFLLFSFSSAPL